MLVACRVAHCGPGVQILFRISLFVCTRSYESQSRTLATLARNRCSTYVHIPISLLVAIVCTYFINIFQFLSHCVARHGNTASNVHTAQPTYSLTLPSRPWRGMECWYWIYICYKERSCTANARQILRILGLKTPVKSSLQ